MIFALTTNAIIIFIMYFYMYLLKSLYFLEFIVVYIFIRMECIYSNCFSTVFIGNVFIQFYFWFFIYIYWIRSSLLLFNTCTYKIY